MGQKKEKRTNSNNWKLTKISKSAEAACLQACAEAAGLQAHAPSRACGTRSYGLGGVLTYAAGFRPSRDTTFALSFCGLLLLGPQSGVHRLCTTATRFSRPLPVRWSPDNLQALSPVMGPGLDPSQTQMSHSFSAQSAHFPLLRRSFRQLRVVVVSRLPSLGAKVSWC